MSSEMVFRPGMRVESALQDFRSQINRRATISSTEQRTLRKLLPRLQPLLADPITADQAQAFDDALHGRYTITLDAEGDHFTASGTVEDSLPNGTTMTGCFVQTADRLTNSEHETDTSDHNEGG